jgi:hypothetical protein
LKDLPGPKTIVLVSEGMIVDPRRVDLSQLTAQAQAARVTIYGLQLEIPTFEAAQERVSPTAARDLDVRRDGVSRVVGAARGAVYRQVGTDPKPFERITREITGYYLLAFEARDGDREGRPHRVRVTLARGRRGELRARTGFTLPPATPAARCAELTALLRSLALVTELPLRVATYAYAEPSASAVRVVVSAEAGGTSTPSGTWLGFVLVDSAGVIAATAITHHSYLRTRDYNRGLLAENQGRPEDALRHYLAGVESGVDHPDVYNAAAWMLTELPYVMLPLPPDWPREFSDTPRSKFCGISLIMRSTVTALEFSISSRPSEITVEPTGATPRKRLPVTTISPLASAAAGTACSI